MYVEHMQNASARGKILKTLKKPRTLDQIMFKSGLSWARVQYEVAMLEIFGKVEKETYDGDVRYRLRNGFTTPLLR